jgi:ABC-type lipoprotein export system ATPase subunit
MSEVAVETYGLTKTYKSGGLENPVLKGIELEVERGEVISIMGSSGCGKTTHF